jgi:hypothetical protein
MRDPHQLSQIIIGNILIEQLVDKLTEFENHRTNTQFEDAYCSKLFSFVFVNSYLSVLYIAFVAEHMPKVKFSCMLV